jgi:3-(3-hydroxy-phenyl)propionate hydroxylase
LSVPTILAESGLNTPDTSPFAGAMVPGAPLDDAPVRVAGREEWLLEQVGGRFTTLVYVEDASTFAPAQRQAVARVLADAPVPVDVMLLSRRGGAAPGTLPVLEDFAGRYAERYDARNGTVYLARPDQHVCGRWRAFDPGALLSALARASCND